MEKTLLTKVVTQLVNERANARRMVLHLSIFLTLITLLLH